MNLKIFPPNEDLASLITLLAYQEDQEHPSELLVRVGELLKIDRFFLFYNQEEAFLISLRSPHFLPLQPKEKVSPSFSSLIHSFWNQQMPFWHSLSYYLPNQEHYQTKVLFLPLFYKGEIRMIGIPEDLIKENLTTVSPILQQILWQSWYHWYLQTTWEGNMFFPKMLWKCLLADSRHAIRICRGDGKITFLSPTAQKWFQCQLANSQEPHNLYDWLDNPSDVKAFQSSITELLLNKREETEVEWSLQGEGGERMFFRTRIYRMEKSEFLLLLDENITEEETLSNCNQKLRFLAETAHFACGAAHDINNLLSVLMMNLEFIQTNPELPSNLLSTLQNSLQILSQIRDLSRGILELGHISHETNRLFSVHDVINEAVSFLQQVKRSPNILIRTKLSATDSTVFGKPTFLKNTLLNLGLNALHAIGDKGKIDIITHTIPVDSEKGFPFLTQQTQPIHAILEITVRDTGHGIPPEILARIFKEEVTTSPGKGHGLGLQNAKRYIQDMGGTIDIESQVGKGTIVRIFLPVAATTEKPSVLLGEPLTYEEMKGILQGEILIVDDEESVCEITATTLKILGLKPTPCTNPTEALNYIQKDPHRFRYALIDFRMPGLNGGELATQCLNLSPQMGIILVTGGPCVPAIQELTRNPRVKFLAKPFGIKEITEIIQSFSQ